MNRVIVVTPVAERNNKSTSTKSLGLNSTSVSSSDPTKSSLLRQPNAGVGIIGGVSADVTVDISYKARKIAMSLEAKLKPIEAGSPVRIGVLATNAILNAGFYQDKLQKEVLTAGFGVIPPDKATMEHTIIPSTEAKSRKDIEGAQNLLLFENCNNRPYWGYVEMVTTNIQDIKDALKGEEYETKTRGHKHKLPAIHS
ncbi:probable amino-acid racemase [Tanacetum coccineum]